MSTLQPPQQQQPADESIKQNKLIKGRAGPRSLSKPFRGRHRTWAVLSWSQLLQGLLNWAKMCSC